MKALSAIVCIGALLGPFPAAHAKDKPGKGHGQGNDVIESEPSRSSNDLSISGSLNTGNVSIHFSSGETRALRGYYLSESAPAPKALPPGLQKKVARGGDLPPGWKRKFGRGEAIPAEQFRYAERVPVAVVGLPPQPPNTVLIRLDGQIARVNVSTRVVLDLFDF